MYLNWGKLWACIRVLWYDESWVWHKALPSWFLLYHSYVQYGFTKVVWYNTKDTLKSCEAMCRFTCTPFLALHSNAYQPTVWAPQYTSNGTSFIRRVWKIRSTGKASFHPKLPNRVICCYESQEQDKLTLELIGRREPIHSHVLFSIQTLLPLMPIQLRLNYRFLNKSCHQHLRLVHHSRSHTLSRWLAAW